MEDAEAKVKVMTARSTKETKRRWILDILRVCLELSTSAFEDETSFALGDVGARLEARTCFSGSSILSALVEAIIEHFCGEKERGSEGCRVGLKRSVAKLQR